MCRGSCSPVELGGAVLRAVTAALAHASGKHMGRSFPIACGVRMITL